MPQQKNTPNTTLLTAIGTGALAQAWRATLQAFTNHNTDEQITSMQLLAATTGDPEIMQEFKKWKQEFKNQLALKQTRIMSNKLEAYARYTTTILPFIEETNSEIYTKLITLLRKKGLIEFTKTQVQPLNQDIPSFG